MPQQAIESATAVCRPGLVSVDGRTYPLESAKVTARAEGGIALSRLTQVFANPYEQALEVVYTMPLPADGAVLGYTIRMGEKLIHGVVEPREKAEAAFRRALSQGRSAGLLEQDRDDTFQQRLGNIPPATKVEVEIQVLQRLASLAGTGSLGAQWEYRFPTVVGVRYQGTPGRVPDAERFDLGRDAEGVIATRLEIGVTVADRTATATHITSPSHSIVCDPVPEGTQVRFGEGERLDRDLVLRWPACAAESGARVVLGRGLEGDDGRYGLVTMTPPSAPGPILRRDLTVLIDASGSMSGEPIEYAKQVVKALIQSLEPDDNFELLAFSNQVIRLSGAMAQATPDALRRARRALAALKAGGGTEMADAIEKALRPLRHDSQRQVVLVTDGEISFEREVIAGIMNGLPDGCRVHTVGIGSAPNRSLTAGVARAGRGVELLVNDSVTAREGARRLCAATARPVITEVSIEGTALLRGATTRLRDVFAGQPLVAPVELRHEGGTLEVHGQLAGSADRWVWRIGVPEAHEASADAPETPLPIGALFGREVIADLELTLAATEDNSDAIDGQIEALGMRHRIASRRTSLVAIAEEPGVDVNAPRRRERIAVELPAGVSAVGSGLLGSGELATSMIMMQRRPGLTGLGNLTARSRLAQSPLVLSRSLAGATALANRDELLRTLHAELHPATRDARDAIERLQHEVEALRRAIWERLARIRAAAEELMDLLARERERIDLLAVSVRKAAAAAADKRLHKRVEDVLRRLESHSERMRSLADRIAGMAQEWADDPLKTGRAHGDLETALHELIDGGLAQTHTALVEELSTLVTTELLGKV